MALSLIVVVLFLQGTVQIGLVEGIDFRGKARVDLSTSSKSVSGLEAWMKRYTSARRKPVSFCVIEPDVSDDNALAAHVRKRLIAREDAGELDIYSSHGNVMSSGAVPEPESITFERAAAYCIATIATIKASGR